jgi:hypothetical protein
VPLRCPRCGSQLEPEQDWCLDCGAPARTRLAPIPNWRLPLAVAAAIVLAAAVTLALAFVTLTRDDPTVLPPTTTAAPVEPNEQPPSTVPAPDGTAQPPAQPQPVQPDAGEPQPVQPDAGQPRVTP